MSKQLGILPSRWDKEFALGKWNYLDEDSAERSRHAIIGMLCQQHAPKGRILDVGCGEGTLTDFLNPKQKKKYLGIDISKEAIKIGIRKRHLNFQLQAAETFSTTQSFDVIVLNEMLYYVDDKKVLEKFAYLLGKDSILIISVYRMKSERYDQQILRHARAFLNHVDTVEVTAMTKQQKVTWHIETFVKK